MVPLTQVILLNLRAPLRPMPRLAPEMLANPAQITVAVAEEDTAVSTPILVRQSAMVMVRYPFVYFLPIWALGCNSKSGFYFRLMMFFCVPPTMNRRFLIGRGWGLLYCFFFFSFFHKKTLLSEDMVVPSILFSYYKYSSGNYSFN